MGIVIYQGQVRPGADRISNHLDLFNEMSVLICTDNLILFTDYLDLTLHFQVGWAWCAILLTTAAINLGFIFYHSFRRFLLTVLKYYRIAKKKIGKCLDVIKDKLPYDFDDF